MKKYYNQQPIIPPVLDFPYYNESFNSGIMRWNQRDRNAGAGSAAIDMAFIIYEQYTSFRLLGQTV
jgi:hypothetical protein